MTVWVSPAATLTNGLTFQPCPRSLAAGLNGNVPGSSGTSGTSGSSGSGTAIAPLPFSPVGFSGLTERVRAPDSSGSPASPAPSGVKSSISPPL